MVTAWKTENRTDALIDFSAEYSGLDKHGTRNPRLLQGRTENVNYIRH